MQHLLPNYVVYLHLVLVYFILFSQQIKITALNVTYRLVFVMGTDRVLCELETEVVHITNSNRHRSSNVVSSHKQTQGKCHSNKCHFVSPQTANMPTPRNKLRFLLKTKIKIYYTRKKMSHMLSV
jgi:hypothetical protein